VAGCVLRRIQRFGASRDAADIVEPSAGAHDAMSEELLALLASRATPHRLPSRAWLTSPPDASELLRWVPIELRLEDGLCFAENADLSLYGVGADAEEAIDDFRTTLGEVLMSFRETPPDELTPEARRYVEDLEQYVRSS
jgi:hypothetical protein